MRVADTALLPVNRRMYAAGLLTALTGVAALSSAVESPGFFVVTALLLTAGYAVSMGLKGQGRNLRIVEGIVILICLATYARLFATGEANPLLNPGNALFHKELSLAVMLVWAEVVRSFSLVSDEALLFTGVPSLALIGVVATSTPDSGVLVYFAAWLVAACMLFLESGRSPSERSPRDTRPRVILLSGALGLGALLVGMIVSPAVHRSTVMAFVRMAPGIYATRHSSDVSVGDSESNTLPISDGPVRFSDRELMRVRTNQQAYWRTRVWDSYGGRDWKTSAEPQLCRPADVTAGGELVFRGADDTARPPHTSRVEQTFTASAGFGNLLHAAAEPVQVSIRSSALQRDSFNCWRVVAPPGFGVSSYTVVSNVPVASEKDLRDAPAAYPPGIRERYLFVPLSAERVRALSLHIAGRIASPYDRVMALRRYLAANCVYDLEAPPVPLEVPDAVTHFIFTSRRGYCDIFASSLAIMARSVGVPARIATGFMPGEYDSQTGEYVVRDKDRHSWTEVYFPGYGWMPVEATPAGGDDGPGFWRALWFETRLMLRTSWVRLSLLAVSVLMVLIALRVVSTEDTEQDALPRRALRPEARRAQVVWRRLSRLLARRGVPVRRSATPMELYVAFRASVEGGDAGNAVEAVRQTVELLNRVLFSGHRGDEDLVGDLDAAFAVVRREMAGVCIRPSAQTRGFGPRR